MSQVAKIELFHVDVPLSSHFHPAWIPGYPQTHNRFTLIRLTTDDGYVGLSAGTAFEREREGLGSLLGPYLLGLDATDIPAVQQRLREAGYLGWRNAWIEPAFWDLKGKIQGKPVYQLLQDEPRSVSEVDVYASSGELRPFSGRRAYLDEIRRRGFRAVKLRVHSFDEAEDVALMRSAREYLGPDFPLMVDANQGWRVTVVDDAPLWDLERATRFGRVCDDLGVGWIEEPLPMDDYDAQAELSRRVQTPIAGGELNAGWHEIKVMLEKGSYAIYQPDVTFAGGLAQARQVMQGCREHGKQFSPHTWTNGIGFLINLHAYAAWDRHDWLEYPFEPPGWIPRFRDAVLKAPIEVSPRGTVRVPQEPGLGIELDPWALRRYGKRFYIMTPARLAVHTVLSKGLRTALELKRKRDAREGTRR